MKTIYLMMIATLIFCIANLVFAHPEQVTEEWTESQCVVVNDYAYCEGDAGYEQAVQLIDDCLSDYVLDWESESCDFLRPTDYDYDRDEYDEWELEATL